GSPHDLVRRHRRPVDRLPGAGGLRLRRRAARARRRTRRDRPPTDDQRDRAGVGRQRGVADHRDRRDVRRVPGLVRGRAVRLLPAGAGDRAGPGAARGGVRVPRQARRPGLARPLGRRDRRRQRRARVRVGPGARRRRARRRARARRRRPLVAARPAQPLRPARRVRVPRARDAARGAVPRPAHHRPGARAGAARRPARGAGRAARGDRFPGPH
ncbi:MAG: Cytochrome bd terminal oxidase subunit II, partial [uncultured Pseudonocardia sp.]